MLLTVPQHNALAFTDGVAVSFLCQVVRAKEDKKQYIQLNKSLMNMSMSSMSRPGSAQVQCAISTARTSRLDIADHIVAPCMCVRVV